MKISLFVSMLILVCLSSNAQPGVFATRGEAREAIKGNCYETSICWLLRVGQSVTLGKGSMPDRKFSFILEESSRVIDEKHHRYFRQQLSHIYNGRKVEISNFAITGNRKTGFRIEAKLKVGQITRYMMDVESALEAGELALPAEYQKPEPRPMAPGL